MYSRFLHRYGILKGISNPNQEVYPKHDQTIQIISLTLKFPPKLLSSSSSSSSASSSSSSSSSCSISPCLALASVGFFKADLFQSDMENRKNRYLPNEQIKPDIVLQLPTNSPRLLGSWYLLSVLCLDHKHTPQCLLGTAAWRSWWQVKTSMFPDVCVAKPENIMRHNCKGEMFNNVPLNLAQ